MEHARLLDIKGPNMREYTGDVRYPVGGTPVPPRRRGGTAYAERRYQLGAVLILHTMLSIIHTTEATTLAPEGVFASLIYLCGGWLLLHFVGFTGFDSAQHAAHFRS